MTTAEAAGRTSIAPAGVPRLAAAVSSQYELERLVRWMVLAGVTLAAMLVGFVGFSIWRGFNQAIAAAEVETMNLARLVAAQAAQGISGVDLNLLTTERVFRRFPTGVPATGPQIDWLLNGRLALMPHASFMLTTDRDGVVNHMASRHTYGDWTSFSKEDFFTWQRDHPGNRVYVGAPALYRLDTSYLIPVSRRLTSPDGQFDGIILAAMEPRFLHEIHSVVNVGDGGVIRVSRRDGILLSSGVGEARMIGKSFASTPLFTEHLPKSDRGSFRTRSTIDGVERVVSYAAVPDTDLVATAGISEDKALAAWRDSMHTQIAATAVFLASLAGLIALLIGQLRRQQATSRTLARSLLRLEAIHAMDKAILEAQSSEVIAATGLEQLYPLVPYWGATAMFFDHAAGEARMLHVARQAGSAFGPGARVSLDDYGREDLATLENGQECVVRDMDAMPRMTPVLEKLYARGMRSYARVPLIAEGALVGALNLGNNAKGAFTREEIAIARSIADSTAIALRQAGLREAVERHAAELEQRIAERTAQLEESNKALEMFNHSIAHDLRGPIHAMTGFAGVLLEDAADRLDDKSKGYLGRIHGAAERLNGMIDGLLTLSQAAINPLSLREVDLSAIAQRVARALKDAEPDRRVAFSIAPGLTARADPHLIEDVLENLLRNAWKYTSHHATASIEFGMAPHDEGGHYFVRDDGAGFDMKYAAQLFRPFGRLHTKEEFAGTGIGLTTVRRIIERHGGQIWAESAVEKGTTFHFTLPQSA